MKRISILSSTLSVAVLLFTGLVYGSEAPPAGAPVVHRDWNFSELRWVPIQSGGRVKPLDTFAREAVLLLTGSRSFKGFGSSSAIDLLMSWIAVPEVWEKVPMIQVAREDVRRQLGLPEKQKLFSPAELMSNAPLIQYASQGMRPQGVPSNLAGDPNETPSKTGPREQELKIVLDRIGFFHSLITGQNLLLIPRPTPEAWVSLVDTAPVTAEANAGSEKDGEVIRTQFARLIKAYQAEDQNGFERASRELMAAVEGGAMVYPEFDENQFKSLKTMTRAEVLFNRLRLFFYAWVGYLISGSLWVAHEWRTSRSQKRSRLKRAALVATFFALACHLSGMALRSFIAGRPPVTNMYESVVWVSFGVILFALILYALSKKQGVILAVASFLAVLGLVAADVSPTVLDPSIRPLVPVLRSNYWLTIHVLTITLGYAAFALSLGLSNLTLFQYLKQTFKKSTQNLSSKISNLNQLTYRAVQFGVVLIAAGTILGGIWADYSWGRFWGWDPKEVWALITLLTYLVILHGRFTNWIGQYGFAAWSSVAFLSVLMAWYGVNFVLGAGLHSYGFASGGTPWVMAFVALQLAYIGGVSLKVAKAKGAKAKGH